MLIELTKPANQRWFSASNSHSTVDSLGVIIVEVEVLRTSHWQAEGLHMFQYLKLNKIRHHSSKIVDTSPSRERKKPKVSLTLKSCHVARSC